MWEAFKHELQMQIRTHDCENVIRVLGISKGKFIVLIFFYLNFIIYFNIFIYLFIYL